MNRYHPRKPREQNFFRDNGLALFFGVLFLGSLVGQLFAGHGQFNERQLAAGGAPISVGEYLMSGDFAVDVTENWQSEFLQFFLFIYATVWLIQRGSPESKPADQIGTQSDHKQKLGQYTTGQSPAWAKAGGWRTTVYSHSLGTVMLLIFLFSLLVQSVSGLVVYNTERLSEFNDPVSWWAYLGSPDFWNRTLQNWQSEFLAIGSMAVLSVYLRQRGSPESKPVGESHGVTEASG